MTNDATALTRGIAAPEEQWLARARRFHERLTKPTGSLGQLEYIGTRLCAIQRRVPPVMENPAVVVFASDHGVTAAEKVAPYPREVTGQMVANFVRGGAAINVLAHLVGASLNVVDVGVAHPVAVDSSGNGLRIRRIARGTNNIAQGPAMTRAHLHEAISVGSGLAEELAASGVSAVALGEMGIGNTTVASALTAALLRCPIAHITGRGTGADDAMLASKIAVIERALAVNQPSLDDPLDVLQKLGGYEIAGLCGVCLGAARNHMAIVADGFISTVAVTLAIRLHAGVGGYVFAGHVSPEPGHRLLLQELRLAPLLDLGMRLGEGTGATLALGLLRAAADIMQKMATFEHAGVDNRK